MSSHHQEKVDSEAKESVALNSVGASALMTLMKLVVGLMTGSMGILSEAAHSLLDLGAAALTYGAVRVSAKPADSVHHYGHGKVESVSALVETGLLFLTSAFIIFEAGKRLLWGGSEVEVTWYAFVVMGISIAIDISRARALSRVAKQTGSQALEADALHFSSDVWSSGVVIVGLGLTGLGMHGADSLAALGVACFVLHAGWQLGKRTIDVLVDAAPVGIADEATEALRSVSGVIDVERVRVRAIGPTVSLDALVLVSRAKHGAEIETILASAEEAVRAKVAGADVVLRAKPVLHASETESEAVRALAGRMGRQVNDIVVESAGETNRISFNLEVEGTLSVRDAHVIADELETHVRETFPGAEVIVHIDPMSSHISPSAKLPTAESHRLQDIVKEIARDQDGIHAVRDIEALSLDGRIALSFRCLVDALMSVEAAHEKVAALKRRILTEVHDVGSVRIHIEPDA